MQIDTNIEEQIRKAQMRIAPPLLFDPELFEEASDVGAAIKKEFDPKPFWKRLLCQHYWVFMGGLPETAMEYATGKFLRFTCKECGARRKLRNFPVNPIERID